MPIRADIFEADIEPPPSAPFILDTLNWVGHGGRHNWCWAACAVMIKLFNENVLPGTEPVVIGHLCKIANLILGTAVKKCCESDTCDELLSIDKVNELWEKILGHPPDHKIAPGLALVGDLINELQGARRVIELDISDDDLIGHAVVIYGFVEVNTEKFFHVRDPSISPSQIAVPHRTMPASVLTDLCRNAWFNLK